MNTSFVVGLPDMRGVLCWLSTGDGDPPRYYTPEHARRFPTYEEAEAAILEAKETHLFKEREYRIVPEDHITTAAV